MAIQGPPQMSPDGAYWWDGKTWQPMPKLGAPVQAPVLASPVVEEAPPLWVQQAKPSSTRSMAKVGAVVVIVAMLGGAGVWGWQQYVESQIPPTNPVSSLQIETVPPDATPGLDQGLTGKLGGEYCPVVHPGDGACFKTSFTNTGPAIGKLAMIFVVGGRYSDWITNHPNSRMTEANTSYGCGIDVPNNRIVCGAVAPRAEINAQLLGVVKATGTFKYAVAFADISSGSPVYVNQRLDGSHDVVTWTELVR
jgi:hypothetical protein